MLGALFPHARADASVKANWEAESFAEAYFSAHKRAAVAEDEIEAAQQGLIALLGNFETMSGDGWRLNYKDRPPVEVPAYTRKGYRHFDLRPSKNRKIQ